MPSVNRPPFIVGLTGGIGSGKSAAAEHFARLGAAVVDTDAIAHELTAAGGAAIPSLVAAFGPDGPLQCSGLPVMRYSADALHGEFGAAFELVEHKAEAHHTPGGAIQQFVYCHCIMH